MMMKSTGLPREESPLSRTRLLADHAGLSLPPELWKEPTSVPLVNSSPSLSSSSSLAPSLTTLAMVVPWPSPSDSTRTTLLSLSLTTPTPLARDRLLLATPALRLPPSRPLVSPWSPPTTATSSRPLLPRDPSLLLLRLINLPSKCTALVSSLALHAELNLTMVSSLLATELRTVPLTTSSRTLGAPPGEMPVTSSLVLSPVLVSAVSRSSPSNPPPTELTPLIKLFLQATERTLITSIDRSLLYIC